MDLIFLARSNLGGTGYAVRINDLGDGQPAALIEFTADGPAALSPAEARLLAHNLTTAADYLDEAGVALMIGEPVSGAPEVGHG